MERQKKPSYSKEIQLSPKQHFCKQRSTEHNVVSLLCLPNLNVFLPYILERNPKQQPQKSLLKLNELATDPTPSVSDREAESTKYEPTAW